MIELEVYAAGLRNIDKILELDHQLEAVPGLRYKVRGGEIVSEDQIVKSIQQNGKTADDRSVGPWCNGG